MNAQTEHASKAVVVTDTHTDNSISYNVEYFDEAGKRVLIVGCMDEVDAEQLAECLNNASWVDVPA